MKRMQFIYFFALSFCCVSYGSNLINIACNKLNSESLFLDESKSIVNQKNITKDKILYIIEKYQKVMNGKEYLFYPAKKTKKLVIIFNGANKGKYSQFTWWWDDKEEWASGISFLFLKDDDFTWYLGNNEHDFIQDYSAIIEFHIKLCNVSRDAVFAMGSSMGGYASIFYATLLKLKGVCVINPQVNKVSNIDARFGLNNAEDRWVDLDMLLLAAKKIPYISLIYGQYKPDLLAAECLIDVLKQRASLFIIRTSSLSDHYITPYVYTKEFLLKELHYMDSAKSFMDDKDNKKYIDVLEDERVD